MEVKLGIVGGTLSIGAETRTFRTTRRGKVANSSVPLLMVGGLKLLEELGCVAMFAAVGWGCVEKA